MSSFYFNLFFLLYYNFQDCFQWFACLLKAHLLTDLRELISPISSFSLSLLHRIPTHLQGSLANSGLQQTSSSISGSVAYLTPSVTSSQIVSSDSGLQNVITAAGQRLVTTSVAQQTQQPQQPNAKLVQLAPSFPVASVS